MQRERIWAPHTLIGVEHQSAKHVDGLSDVLEPRYAISVQDGEDMEAKGNIVDPEFEIERGGDKVAEISKRWFRIRDSYAIDVAPGQDDALILACTVCIDQMGRG